jgi:hypothetical protein
VKAHGGGDVAIAVAIAVDPFTGAAVVAFEPARECPTCGHNAMVLTVLDGRTSCPNCGGRAPAKLLITEIDGQAEECTLYEFMLANAEDLDLCSRARKLAPGSSFIVGGGAAPAFSITRLS